MGLTFLAGTLAALPIWAQRPLTLKGAGPFDGYMAVTFLEGGKRVAAVNRDETLDIWDLATGRRRLAGVKAAPAGAIAIAFMNAEFSADGKRLATGRQDGTLCLIETETGKKLHTIQAHQASVGAVAFSADGKTVATCALKEGAKLWEVASGKALATFENEDKKALATSVALSPDSKLLAVGNFVGTVALWDVTTREQLRTLKHPSRDQIQNLTFAPDGKTLISAGGPNPAGVVFGAAGIQAALKPGELLEWTVANGKRKRIYRGQAGPIVRAVFSADGKALVSSGMLTELRVWNVRTARSRGALRNVAVENFAGGFGSRSGTAAGLALSPDGGLLASTVGGYINVWTLSAKKTRRRNR